MLDLAVVNAEVVTPTGLSLLDIGIQGGQIALLARRGGLPPAKEELDAAGLLVFPGFIDSHVHFRAPAHAEWEDFRSGSAAAAAGGVTTFIEMPNSSPPVTTGDRLKVRAELAERESYVDFGLYAGGAAGRPSVETAAGAGAVAYKIFTHAPIPERASEFAGVVAVREAELLVALTDVSKTGLVCAVHAEDNDLAEWLQKRLREEGRNDPYAHAESRPEYVEEVAVNRVLTLARVASCPVHFCHITTGRGLELIREAKSRGEKVTAEVCAHHVAFNADAISVLGPYAKINPPLRGAREVAALWEGIRDGTVDSVSSDHCGYRTVDKEPGWSDIWRVPPGVGGIQVFAPVFLTLATERGIPPWRIAALLAENPAKIFRLWPKKGWISPYADADLVLVRPGASWMIELEEFKNKGRASGRIYAGVKVTHNVVTTLSRGVRVFENGRILGSPGHGRLVLPQPTARESGLC